MNGLEPLTCWLQISCSANWATSAYVFFLLRAARKLHFPARKMTPRGFEPLLPPWKGGVLTAWPWSLVSYLCPCSFFPVFSFLFPVLCTCFLMQKSSPSRARTYNPSVNSRVLYHWAIEEYLLNYRCQLFLSATFNILSHFHHFVNNFFNFFLHVP